MMSAYFFGYLGPTSLIGLIHISYRFTVYKIHAFSVNITLFLPKTSSPGFVVYAYCLGTELGWAHLFPSLPPSRRTCKLRIKPKKVKGITGLNSRFDEPVLVGGHGLDVDHLGALHDHVGRRGGVAQARRGGRQELLQRPRLGARHLQLKFGGRR